MNRGQNVSIIITSKDEEDVIGRLLKSILGQVYQNREIIVVDNNSVDKTKQIAKKFTNKIYNIGPERSAQRNYGVRQAKEGYLLFLDADMELTPNVIKECVELSESDKKIGGIVIPEESIGRNYWENVKGFERSFYNEEGDEVTDAARFFTKAAFEKAGGYDEKITGPEDWDLPENIKKSGFKISRIKAKIYHHERISSIFSIIKKKFYYGLKAYRYLHKQNISAFSPKTLFFLRPVFYRKWRKLTAHPILFLGMIVMLFLELVGGGLGFIIGKIKRL